MRIPSKQECYQLICRMEMLDNIVIHSLQVCRVAMLLVDHIQDTQRNLNRDMVMASALLHDITKTRSFKTKENHALTGEQLLVHLGYPEVGSIIGQHVRLEEYLSSETPDEAEIVNYADKRVLHDQVVSLKERMIYIFEKYVKEPEQRKHFCRLWRKTEELEKKLFKYLSFSPNDLNLLMQQPDYTSEYSAYRKIYNSFSLSEAIPKKNHPPRSAAQ